VVKTSSLRGYLLLYLIASMRGMRRKSLRFQTEHQRIGEWLAAIQRLSASHPSLALEVARSQRLVKGYGDTYARGWGNFQRLMAVLPQMRALPHGEQQLRDLTQAALADDGGQALENLLASVRIDGVRPSV
jgi:indolepyruvate ferredoxin oxidoreductase beta subunit